MANEFGVALRRARLAAGMTLQQLGRLVDRTRGGISAMEVGRVGPSPDLVARLERALGLPAGELARHLPPDHPARRMAAVELPVLGVVAAGPARPAPAEPGEVLRVADLFAGCVAYRVLGDSMLGDQVQNGDYLVVRPLGDDEPRAGQVVVAWLKEHGHVVKRLDRRGTLKSAGWSHRLTGADRVLGRLVGVVRLC